jgi:hypothetical protein
MEDSLLKHRHLEAGPFCLYLDEDEHDAPLEAHTINASSYVLLAPHPQNILRCAEGGFPASAHKITTTRCRPRTTSAATRYTTTWPPRRVSFCASTTPRQTANTRGAVEESGKLASYALTSHPTHKTSSNTERHHHLAHADASMSKHQRRRYRRFLCASLPQRPPREA